jgi:hypothetical protein
VVAIKKLEANIAFFNENFQRKTELMSEKLIALKTAYNQFGNGLRPPTKENVIEWETATKQQLTEQREFLFDTFYNAFLIYNISNSEEVFIDILKKPFAENQDNVREKQRKEISTRKKEAKKKKIKYKRNHPKQIILDHVDGGGPTAKAPTEQKKTKNAPAKALKRKQENYKNMAIGVGVGIATTLGAVYLYNNYCSSAP